MSSKSIDEVLIELSLIVDRAIEEDSRVGYFAAMYRKVTLAIKEAIDTGIFDDPSRMSQLDVVFAQRYISAVSEFAAGHKTTDAWDVAFRAADRWRPVIIQHLIIGMSAHINLDLGIAAATVAPGSDLAALERDFTKINVVLGRLVDGFTADVAEVSPWVGLLDRMGGRTDSALIKFSIEVARNEAWDLASQLAHLPDTDWERIIGARDRWTSGFGEILLRPGWVFSAGLLAIRLRESNDIQRVISVLSA
jgi:hypothetical protein